MARIHNGGVYVSSGWWIVGIWVMIWVGFLMSALAGA